MSEKEFDEQQTELLEETVVPETEADAADAVQYAEETAAEGYDAAHPKLEENDNWEFEAEALTLKNTVIEGDELEIELPEKPVSATRERPKAVKTEEKPAEQKVNTDNKNVTLFLIIAILAVIVIGVLTFFGIRYYTVPNTSEKMNPGNVAMTVGEQKVSLGMYNYYYNSVVNGAKSAAQYGQNDLDIYTDFSEQETVDDDGNTVTWAEMFDKETQEQLTRVVGYYQLALDEGLTLSADEKTQIDSTLNQITSAAEQEGVSVDEYVSKQYGDYCGYATVEKMINMSYLAQQYYLTQSASINPTDEEIQAYSDEHADEYRSVKIAYLMMPYTEDTYEATVAQAEEYAAQINDIDAMKALIPTISGDMIQQYVDAGQFASFEAGVEELESGMEQTISASSGFPEEMADWALSDEAKAGTCKAFDFADGSMMVLLLKEADAALPEDVVYTVRHILIQPETETEEAADAETGEATQQAAAPTEEQMAAAKAKAEEVYQEYLDGEQTEKHFAELAETYSTDPGSTLQQSGVYGGIYENISAGMMVPSFEEWSLDEARKYGDTGIVESDYGYHIMFFVYSGPSYLGQARTQLVMEMQDKSTDDLGVKLNKSVLKKAVKAKPETQSTTDALSDGAPVDAAAEDTAN